MKPNKWFIDFVASFGFCDSKRITEKQAEVFKRYLNYSHSERYAIVHHDEINGLKIHLSDHCSGSYLTITNEENELLRLSEISKRDEEKKINALKHRLEKHPEQREKFIERYKKDVDEWQEELQDSIEYGDSEKEINLIKHHVEFAETLLDIAMNYNLS